ncbi:MAG: nucleotidyl transferase AbiEii/AbiGii toxin family protein [Planctomycetota bacterium]
MKTLTESLIEIAHLFDSLGVPYVVMGGFAVRIHGIPRPTHDVDFTCALDRDALPKFFAAAIEAGYTVPEPYLRGWIDQVAGLSLVKIRLYLQEQGIDIDIFLAECEFQESILARRVAQTLNGNTVWFVTAEDLILLKLIASRPRDLLDVQDVLFTQGQLDEAYLRHWAAELGVTDQLEQALRDARG